MAVKKGGRGYVSQPRQKPVEETPVTKKTGRPISRQDKHSKRTINFSDDLWNELVVIAFIKDGPGGSVTKELHKAAREYIKNANIPEDDFKSLRELILNRLKK